MAVLTQTVGDIVASIAFHLTNSTTIDSVLTGEIKKHLGWTLYDLVTKSQMPAFRVESTISLADGTSDYALPADFDTLIVDSMYYTTSPREWLQFYEEQDAITAGWKERYSTEAKPMYFTLRDRDASTGLFQVRFVATPDASYTVAYSYFAIPQRINEDTLDATEIDVRFPRNLLSGLVMGTAANFTQYLQPDQQRKYEMKYRETMSDLRQSQNPVVGNNYQNKRFRVTSARGRRATWDRQIYNGNPIDRG